MNPLEEANKALDKALETERRNKLFVESIGPAIIKSLLPVIQESLQNIQVNINPEIEMPEVKAPDVQVQAPIVNVPEPVVNVTVPPIKVPKAEVKVNMQNKSLMNELKNVTKAIKSQELPVFEYPEYTFSKPIPSIIVDVEGKPMDFGMGARVNNLMRFLGSDSNPVAVSSTNPLPTTATLSVTSTLDVKQVSGSTDSVFVTGSADSMLAYQARTTNPTAVSDGADVRPSADKLGRTLVRPIQVREMLTTAYATLSTNTETTLISGVSGTFLDLIWLKFSNTSSGAVAIDLRDSTTGNIVDTWEIPANSPVGITMPVPYPQGNAGNNWTVDYNDSDLSNTTVYVSGMFSKEV